MTLQVRTNQHHPAALTLSTTLFAMSLWGIFLDVTAVEASDWDRFRGPNGTGISADADPLPTTFSATENLQWKVALDS